MDSIAALRTELLKSGYSPGGIDGHVDDLVIHACMCRIRADTPTPSGFRELVAYTCKMTRGGRVGNLADDIDQGVRTAACEALFDLIMEGVS